MSDSNAPADNEAQIQTPDDTTDNFEAVILPFPAPQEFPLNDNASQEPTGEQTSQDPQVTGNADETNTNPDTFP